MIKEIKLIYAGNQSYSHNLVHIEIDEIMYNIDMENIKEEESNQCLIVTVPIENCITLEKLKWAEQFQKAVNKILPDKQMMMIYNAMREQDDQDENNNSN